MKQGVFLIGFCLAAFWATAQDNTILYASTTGADTWTGTSVQPYTLIGAVKKAQNDTNIKEIRLAVNEDGKAVYSLTEELVLPDGVKLVGGYAHRGTERVINPAEMIVLKGNGKSRVVTVGKNGVLEGVTVTGGQCRGENGGGVYVREGGKVVNCIIEGNVAIPHAPQVGDLLMTDGSYLSPDKFTYEKKDEVKGVIFWINHDKTTQQEHRGLAVSTAGISQIEFINNGTSVDVLGYPYKTTDEEVMEDYDGEENCKVLENDPDCLAVQMAMGKKEGYERFEGYYLPSIGELFRIYSVWHVLDETMLKLWNVLVEQKNANVLKTFFGLSEISRMHPYDPDKYTDEHHNPINPLAEYYLYQELFIWSSTLQSKEIVYVRNGLTGNTSSEEVSTSTMYYKIVNTQHYRKALVLPVVKF